MSTNEGKINGKVTLVIGASCWIGAETVAARGTYS